ncbi:hypothetical protein GCM10027034_01330 [Ramlibacter solisilvae]|uniref:Candidate membrane protein n=1 Tax=Ramlibacter tataouinensis TaxID=94132 RepID=A0A127JP15_9BURK|nr:hypothetical protein [Ramlibacter tataouinensis]AMO21750.1 hypothetical protein UC35_01250 [Ramlibacter tataouinensis]
MSRPNEQVTDLEALQGLATDLQRQADAATLAYERASTVRYCAIFIPIPFLVLLLRFHMGALSYYLAGGLFMVVLVAMYALDLAALKKRDQAIQDAARAQEACDQAARTSQHTG